MDWSRWYVMDGIVWLLGLTAIIVAFCVPVPAAAPLCPEPHYWQYMHVYDVGCAWQ
jgi:hypothetical protein